MKELTQTIREIAFRCLSQKEADMVIAWQKGSFWWQSYPAFCTEPDETALLTWDPFCAINLSRYLLEGFAADKKIALFLKGCDALGFNQMLQDNRIKREHVFIYGIPCRGLVDPEKVRKGGLGGKLLAVELEGKALVFFGRDGVTKRPASDFFYNKCQMCRYPNPVVCDKMLGDAVPTRSGERFFAVEELEKKSTDERFAYWARHFTRCIRCFACRNVCPACSCRECIFDLREPLWLGKSTELSETQFYQIIRAYHLAGRCVDCGECARVCPVGVPLAELNRKFMKDINELYGEYNAGADPEKLTPLLTFKIDDPADLTGSQGG